MNKTRITGLVLLIIGVITQLAVENNVIEFISAVGIGLGIGLLATGKVAKPSF